MPGERMRHLEHTIVIRDGVTGPAFDRTRLALPRGAVIEWVNRSDQVQTILPDNADTRRAMTLTPEGTDGATSLMQLHALHVPPAPGREYRWRLQSNPAARIAIVEL